MTKTKKLLVLGLSVLFLFGGSVFGQSRDELKADIAKLKTQISEETKKLNPFEFTWGGLGITQKTYTREGINSEQTRIIAEIEEKKTEKIQATSFIVTHEAKLKAVDEKVSVAESELSTNQEKYRQECYIPSGSTYQPGTYKNDDFCRGLAELVEEKRQLLLTAKTEQTELKNNEKYTQSRTLIRSVDQQIKNLESDLAFQNDRLKSLENAEKAQQQKIIDLQTDLEKKIQQLNALNDQYRKDFNCDSEENKNSGRCTGLVDEESSPCEIGFVAAADGSCKPLKEDLVENSTDDSTAAPTTAGAGGDNSAGDTPSTPSPTTSGSTTPEPVNPSYQSKFDTAQDVCPTGESAARTQCLEATSGGCKSKQGSALSQCLATVCDAEKTARDKATCSNEAKKYVENNPPAGLENFQNKEKAYNQAKENYEKCTKGKTDEEIKEQCKDEKDKLDKAEEEFDAANTADIKDYNKALGNATQSADEADKARVRQQLQTQTGFFDLNNLSVGNEKNLRIDGSSDPENQKNNILSRIINLLARLFGTLAVLMMVIGAFFMITSQGDENQLQKGKTIVLYTILGLLLGFTSYMIVQFVINMLYQT